MTKKASMSRRGFLAWLAALPALLSWRRLSKAPGGLKARELREADYYETHSLGG